jgi:hypothetical protein
VVTVVRDGFRATIDFMAGTGGPLVGRAGPVRKPKVTRDNPLGRSVDALKSEDPGEERYPLTPEGRDNLAGAWSRGETLLHPRT